jgi:TolB-like protein/Tfp pilus assembly protein PilF
MRFAGCRLDLDARRLFRGAREVHLSPKAFELLKVLVESRPRAVSKAELLERVWPGIYVSEASLARAVNEIRDGLGDSARQGPIVRTVQGYGYSFGAAVDASPRQIAANVAAKRIKSVAVLPLANLSSDPEQEYLAAGMTEALIADLAQIGALRVISRTSSMRYKATQKSLPAIAGELKVDGLIEGSVLRVGARVRITTQLIHAATDAHVWANSYERDVNDVLGLQREVARAIAEEIRITLTPHERQRLAPVRPVRPDAYEAYLRGRYYWSKVNEKGLSRALEYLRIAVDIDPDFALAHAALADVYIALGAFGGLRPEEAFSHATAAALKALELDQKLAEAHRALAFVKMRQWDWSGAEAAFRLALRFKPGSAETHWQYSVYLVAQGRCAEAIQEAERALALDPLSLMINNDLAFALWTTRRYREAIEQYQRTLELESHFVESRRELGLMYAQAGNLDAAIAQLQQAIALARDTETLAFFGYTLGLAGQRSAAETILNELDEMSTTRYVCPFASALIHLGLGEHDRAFVSLNRAYEERSLWLIFLKTWPVLDPIRSDPRFQDLLRRVGLADDR